MKKSMKKSNPRVITLTTDFGLSDAYVASMKGVILSINPGVTLVDITHNIPPQDVRAAAFLLHTSHTFFPDGAIHLAVVDPGVGSSRRPIALVTPHATFVAPDNRSDGPGSVSNWFRLQTSRDKATRWHHSFSPE